MTFIVCDRLCRKKSNCICFSFFPPSLKYRHLAFDTGPHKRSVIAGSYSQAEGSVPLDGSEIITMEGNGGCMSEEPFLSGVG